MSATMYGWEIVWSPPMGSAASAYAPSRRCGGTKSSRGTRPIAASTRSSSMPRRRSCHSTICALASADARASADIDERLHRFRSSHAEVREHGRGNVRDPTDLGLEADGHDRHERVAGDERAVAPAARVVAAAEVGELPALGRRHEQLAGVRVRERRPDAPGGVWMLQLLDRAVRAVPAGHGVAALEAERDVHRREAVQPLRQLAGIDARTR